MTKRDAVDARHGEIFYHKTLTNADGETPQGFRVTGKCKTWKTRPDEFRLPIKRGLYTSGYITHENADEFKVNEWE